MRRAGYRITEVDALENWQIAEALGTNDPGQDDAPLRSARDVVTERVRHARGEGPRPEPEPADAKVLDMMRFLGGDAGFGRIGTGEPPRREG